MSDWIGYLSIFVLGVFVGVASLGIWLDYMHESLYRSSGGDRGR